MSGAARRETKVPLFVRFGHEANSLALDLLDGEATRASKVIASSPTPSPEQFPSALRPGQRLIVSVGATPGGMDNALPNSEGNSARNAVAAVGDFADLPDRWQGYEGVDMVILSTSHREFLAQAASQPARLDALNQWVHAGGTLVLTAGMNAAESLGPKSPLARFVPGRYDATLQFRGGEQIARGKRWPAATTRFRRRSPMKRTSTSPWSGS